MSGERIYPADDNGATPAGFRRLRGWQDALDLAVSVYGLTHNFPKHELYGLASQMQCAAVTIPANIAEGNTRHLLGDYLRHISIGRASLAELETHLELNSRLAHSSPDDVASIAARPVR